MDRIKSVSIKKITLQNFKGCKDLTVNFSDKETTVCGANATGKTTIFDGLLWVLFNHDSLGQTDFSIRPLDASGKAIDNIDISVSVVISIDGTDYELKKTQKQKWVKKRGQEEQKFSGNVNSFEIDGYPKKEKEFKDFVADIMPEETFNLLTDPMYFTRMPWKEQRKRLMEFVTTKTDAELAEGNEQFSLILSELKKASTDDIRAKYSNQKRDLSKSLDEIPVRIDELTKSKADYNLMDLEHNRDQLDDSINDCMNRMRQSGNDSMVADLKSQLAKAKSESDVMYATAKRELYEARSAKQLEAGKLDGEIKALRQKVDYIETQSKMTASEIENLEKQRQQLADEYRQVQASKFDDSKWQYDESDNVCRMCGQPLPKDKVEQLMKDFEDRKKAAYEQFVSDKTKRLEEVKERGFKVKEEIDKRQSEETLDTKPIREKIGTLGKTLVSLEHEIDGMPTEVDLSNNSDYKALADKIAGLEKQIADAESSTPDNTELQETLSRLQAEIESVGEKISVTKNNAVIDKRIEELSAEHKQVAQKIATVEQVINTLDAFVRYKMKVVSDEINSHFNGVNFKLFHEQINGGIKEICEATVNGVPFATLNNGHRIIAGLEIIKAFQAITDTKTAVWIDNAESVNAYNLPDMDCQVIRLCVTDEPVLVVRK